MVASVSGDADPGYVVAAPALLNAYPNWPGVSTPYSQSTCYGCRGYIGKRGADADAEPGYLAYGYAPFAYGAYGISQAHPTGYSHQHVVRGKRSADADAYYGYPYGYARRGYYGYGGYGYGRGYYWG